MFVWIAILIGVVFFDQLSKYLTILYIKPEGSIPLLEDILHLTYVENTGAAFGMMKDSRWIFMTVSIVAIGAILAYLIIKKPSSRIEQIALAFIVGGGIGNMIDRVLLGYVVDMIDFCLINFAVFNVADSFVCIGAGLMILSMILSMVKEEKAEKAGLLAVDAGGEVNVPLLLVDGEPIKEESETAEVDRIDTTAPTDTADTNEEHTDA